MPIRKGKAVLHLERPPQIRARAAVGGNAEAAGPLGASFDQLFPDPYMGLETWEQAESALLKAALEHALRKGNIESKDVDLLLCGDLLNQCTATGFAARDLGIPLAGLYGACSTFAMALALGALQMDGGGFSHILAAASSHFCAAEKQFRFPLEYGGQPQAAGQRTATAAGALLLEAPPELSFIEKQLERLGTIRESAAEIRKPEALADTPITVGIPNVILGRVVDLGVKDSAEMGAAMAPAACDTLLRFLADTATAPEAYDCILTGDLGQVGSELLYDLCMQEAHIDIRQVHKDGGTLLYDIETQAEAGVGGSGAGCSAAVVCTYVLQQLEAARWTRVLFLGTGALLSAISPLQGQTIPCICHGVELAPFADGKHRIRHRLAETSDTPQEDLMTGVWHEALKNKLLGTFDKNT
ncbi:MAG: stage V sporulation protein AD [Oscillospiraceae bacterium]|jgi:stage V sporulation protein AD|nr:stage V sporulation protein AD [Oscillospiraceae bacterium]